MKNFLPVCFKVHGGNHAFEHRKWPCTMKPVLDADGVERGHGAQLPICTQVLNIMWLESSLKVLHPPANTTHVGRP